MIFNYSFSRCVSMSFVLRFALCFCLMVFFLIYFRLSFEFGFWISIVIWYRITFWRVPVKQIPNEELWSVLSTEKLWIFVEPPWLRHVEFQCSTREDAGRICERSDTSPDTGLADGTVWNLLFRDGDVSAPDNSPIVFGRQTARSYPQHRI